MKIRDNNFGLKLLLWAAALCIGLLDGRALANRQKEGPVLDSAEGFFLALEARDYGKAWSFLTEESKRVIVKDVCKETAKLGAEKSEEETRRDFDEAGPLSKGFWDAYVENFDPDLALKESVWKMGEIKKDSAVVELRIKGPAYLKMIREGGQWRVGLVESFWNRK